MKTIDFSQLRVLLVDDDRPTREMVVEILEAAGIGRVDRAANGQEAFNRLRESLPDLIVSDVMMEPMDGITFTRRIRTHRESPSQNIPVILLTAHTDLTTVLEARDAGVNAFVAKPVSIDELKRKITLVLNDPRAFIRSEDYVGPDRRVRAKPLGGRPDRRKKPE
ncbi:response regulator [Thalassobaculum fulvum]|jgi:CheY-like chemotaxis protein|nr:response regulator [Thalassobaculum fulvum]